jgi:hypothetical protein
MQVVGEDGRLHKFWTAFNVRKHVLTELCCVRCKHAYNCAPDSETCQLRNGCPMFKIQPTKLVFRDCQHMEQKRTTPKCWQCPSLTSPWPVSAALPSKSETCITIVTFTLNAAPNQTTCSATITIGGTGLMRVQRHTDKRIQGKSAETLLSSKSPKGFGATHRYYSPLPKKMT